MAIVDNLVSYWKLDESSGNASDSVGSNTLTNKNGVTFSSGKINNGIDLEIATVQSMYILDASQTGLDITGDISISAWIKLESLASTGNETIVAKWHATGAGFRAYQFDITQTTNLLRFQISSDGGSSNVNVATCNTAFDVDDLGVWHHCVVTVDVSSASAGITIYIDGVAQSVTASGTQTSIANTTAQFDIGARNYLGTPTELFDGMIDEVGVWSRELTSGEVTSLYNSGNGLSYPFVNTSARPTLLTLNVG